MTITITAKLLSFGRINNAKKLRLNIETIDSLDLLFYLEPKDLNVDVEEIQKANYVKVTFMFHKKAETPRRQKQLKVVNIEPTTEQEFKQTTNKFTFKGKVYKQIHIHKYPFTTFLINTEDGDKVVLYDEENISDYLSLTKTYIFVTEIKVDRLYTKEGEPLDRQQVYFKIIQFIPPKINYEDVEDGLTEEIYGIPKTTQKDKDDFKEVWGLYKKYYENNV